jgi:hypothetical protein
MNGKLSRDIAITVTHYERHSAVTHLSHEFLSDVAKSMIRKQCPCLWLWLITLVLPMFGWEIMKSQMKVWNT